MSAAADSSAAQRGSQEAQSDQPLKPKKVRSACRRCRDRRIKCDGQTPSCAKCAKAGVPCIDVDTLGNRSSVPRGFVTDAQHRLEWLESLVKDRLPDVDLADGPSRAEVPSSPAVRVEQEATQSAQPPVGSSTEVPLYGYKRKRTSDHDHAQVSKKAQRMALDLGLFSLNANSSRAHYLGSSSGSLFANLLTPDDYLPKNSADGPDVDPGVHSDTDDEHFDERPSASQGVIEMLKVIPNVLPAKDECQRLTRIFFKHYHAEYPILHQPSIEALVEALYASATLASTTTSSTFRADGWPTESPVFQFNGVLATVKGQQGNSISIHMATTILLLVLGIAASLQTRKRVYTIDPARYLKEAIPLLQSGLGEICLPSVQAMLLLVIQNFLTPAGGNMWVTLHIAMSYAVDLGLHRNIPTSTRLVPTMAQMRRRVFLCLYRLDRYVSTAQGRPIGFSDDSLDLAMPSTPPLTADADASRQDIEFLPYACAGFRWAQLISEIKHQLYRFSAQKDLATSIQDTQNMLQSKVDTWLRESAVVVDQLSRSLRTSLTLKLQIKYQFAIGLIYQPSQACRNPNTLSLQRCLDSASQRIRSYWSLYSQQDLVLTWPNTHGVFLAGATLVYCIWSSAELRTSISVADVAVTIRLCSSLLTLGAEWWPLARRGSRSFERLADSTIALLDSRNHAEAIPVTATSSTLPSDSIPQHQPLIADPNDLTTDSMGTAFDDSAFFDHTQWFDIESILQPFLQGDDALLSVLDNLDASPFDMFGSTEVQY